MQRLTKLASILLIFSAIGCGKEAVTGNAATEKGTTEKSATEKAVSTQGVTEKNVADNPLTSKAIDSDDAPSENKQASQPVQGQASWYGPGHYGNKTASGEILKKGTMTAAHSSLPMGTKVRVTRLDNNKSVTVVINDRKPFKQGTVIDLAHGSATALDVDDEGKTSVEVEVLD
ncbi:RlpA-like protein precursor [Synechococcus sp. MIT S9509]|uniref:septal ring lytic transglycosylase RlpA family protein n=2 Tax=Synechococcus TaxID=1129 RepID=UPI0007BC122C|nr:septal ring lytic transglycosylase RlpA family protein [Synechococcus sp. MIT S9504]KZR86530.1 RlpA-like protein precursor [Synechococcus sp. MIT S9504]KZR92530.1 RlpA-like protein precursor [Synechococcus sp. MIT S9509]